MTDQEATLEKYAILIVWIKQEIQMFEALDMPLKAMDSKIELNRIEREARQYHDQYCRSV